VRPFYLYDSSKKEKCKLIPITPPQVTLYACGPTVYDDAHLGHAKSALSFDLLKRTLTACGYHVLFARNITDIDDKIIRKSFELDQNIHTITTHYTQRYQEDMSALGIQTPDLEPKATENLDAMIGLIQTLMDKNIAYTLPNGDVYFDISKDAHYGTLSSKTQEDRQSRVEATEKRNDGDFVLWKGCKEKDVCFESPFGSGRPGWHLECSAMIAKHLRNDGAYQIDIHAGGADLFFPHHENEAAQTRCAYEQELAHHWMHNGFVTVNGEKMSKSLGNSFFLKDALEHYDGEVLRFYLLSTHYRADFNFSEEDLLSSKKRLDKLYRLLKRLFGGGASAKPDKGFECEMLDALCDDLNISKALAAMDMMIANANEALDKNPKDKAIKKSTLANLQWIAEVLGFGNQNPYHYFQWGIDTATKTRIQDLLSARKEAKEAKDFTKADEIRDEILGMGVQIMDTPQGTFWEKV